MTNNKKVIRHESRGFAKNAPILLTIGTWHPTKALFCKPLQPVFVSRLLKFETKVKFWKSAEVQDSREGKSRFYFNITFWMF